MKHNFSITVMLVLLFLITQIIGLFILNQDLIVQSKILPSGEITTQISHQTDSTVPRPEVAPDNSYIYITLAVFVGTLLVLFMIKWGLGFIWKYWFFAAVALSSTFALQVFFLPWIALGIGLVLAWLKIYKNNVYTHNLTEILIYTGIAVLFVPIMSLFSVAMLMMIIALYDVYAVFHSKHMVDLAKFQTEKKLFAGFSLPYKMDETTHKKTASVPHHGHAAPVKTQSKVAILGGGDIAFPLLFSGVVMEHLVSAQGMSKLLAYFTTLLIPLVVAFSLFLLLAAAKKDKFYPAMPAVALGCFVGYGIILLL